RRCQKLQVSVLEKRKQLLGNTHLDTLWSMSGLGLTHACLSQYKEAEELQAYVLEMRRKFLGDDHPHT
ncbi:hypothetical protein B0H14DRAFT_2206882, partial [Mycena olivaceomarginata]